MKERPLIPMLATMIGVALAISFSTIGVALAQSSRPAMPEMVANGISSYRRVPIEGGVLVSLYDESGSVVGSAAVVITEDGHLRADWSGADGSRIQVERIGAGDLYRLIDVRSGEVGTMSFDHQSRHWRVDTAAEDIIAMDKLAIELAASSMDVGIPEIPDWPSSSPGSNQGSDQSMADGNVECLGPQCRGFSASLTRSSCCMQARREAGNCCSNEFCWGCCGLLSCDSNCVPLFGDYFCYCGVTGWSCSGGDEMLIRWW